MSTASIILRLLDLAVVGALTAERARALRAQVDAMQAEGRAPTDQEWAALLAQIDGDSARLAGAAANPESRH